MGGGGIAGPGEYRLLKANHMPGIAYLAVKSSLCSHLMALRREFASLVPRLLELEPRAAEAREYMLSVAPRLMFDAHDRDGKLRQPDAASAALRELAVKLGYAKPIGSSPCAGGRPLES